MVGKTFKFIHLTDTHIIPRPQKLFGVDVQDNLARAVDSINRNFNDSEFCIITGDLAHWGEIEAYSQLKEILNELSIPWHILIGNHDSRFILQKLFPNLLWSKDGFLNYTISTPVGEFLILDTVDEGKNYGRLCEIRLRWLHEQLLQTNDDRKNVYLFMHHPPMEIGIRAMDLIGLVNPQDLVTTLQGFKHIRHLFFGHLHRTCHGSWRGIPFSTVKASCYQVELRLDGKKNLTCSHENPAYAVVQINSDSVVIHDHSYMEENKTFIYDRGAPARKTTIHQKA